MTKNILFLMVALIAGMLCTTASARTVVLQKSVVEVACDECGVATVAEVGCKTVCVDAILLPRLKAHRLLNGHSVVARSTGVSTFLSTTATVIPESTPTPAPGSAESESIPTPAPAESVLTPAE